MIIGEAAPYSEIRLLRDDGSRLGETVAGPDGGWQLAIALDDPGTLAMIAEAFAPGGMITVRSAPVEVTVVAAISPTTGAEIGTPGATGTALLIGLIIAVTGGILIVAGRILRREADED